ncbi:T9SS type A sorting domain-containing protein [Dyadobacter chenwenxiniae]|uniref:T9SS type A sorting domain-containing protein n=1 Tax=Dyadobacter chenwenxiniae TaxID=2906456 RepID=A0A9X1PN89_9BACT|nr:T9SS type A sorting domain-containing protein [Dyadobacter chenwenxiniae]MCF0062688.1 T9SS type A sorting domain-containing protein [Dyadobacter chenwenxiniae]UON83567.1 T9SS type A sorting domain-containing protein [Dyadobacter chenwenxiniae]
MSVIVPTVYGQDFQGVSTKRGAEIGLVTFGQETDSNVLGGGKLVDGYVRKKGAKGFIFPVGDNGTLRPFKASGDQTIGAYFQSDPGAMNGELPTDGPFATSALQIDVSAVSKKEFWDINGNESTNITLTWNASSEIENLLKKEALNKLTIVGWRSGKWERIPSVTDNVSILGGSSTVTSGSITSDAAFSPDNYAVYSIGLIAQDALPVVLASFNATAVEQTAVLEWATVSEVNANYFSIERSADAKSWAEVGNMSVSSKTAPGTTPNAVYQFTDQNPLQGSNYYRLKMADLDGSFAYSQIRDLHFGNGNTISFYPNPVSDTFYLTGVNASQVRNATLFDRSGKAMKMITDIGNGISVVNVPQGIYMLRVTTKNGMSSSQKVLIEH